MELLFGPTQAERLKVEKYAIKIGFETWAAGNVADILELCAEDKKRTLAYAWNVLANKTKNHDLRGKVKYITTWMTRTTVDIMLNSHWRTYPKQLKLNIKRHMKKIYPISKRPSHPYNLDYIFKNFNDPWKRKYFGNLSKIKEFAGVKPADRKLIKKEGFPLIIMRAIKIAERGTLEASMHLLLKLLCAWDGAPKNRAVRKFLRKTPRADQYADCARHLVVAILMNSMRLLSKYSNIVAKIIQIGIEKTERDYRDVCRSILPYSTTLNLKNKIGKMIYEYMQNLLGGELELLFSNDSTQSGFVNDRFGDKLLDIFIGQMESTKRFGKLASQMANDFLQNTRNLESLQNLYVKLNERESPQWRKTKETLTFTVLIYKVINLLMFQQDTSALLNDRRTTQCLLNLREELSHVYANFANLVRNTMIKRELRFTAFCLYPCKQFIHDLVKLKPKQLYEPDEYYSKLQVELDNYQQPITLQLNLRDVLGFCRIPNLSMLDEWKMFTQKLNSYLLYQEEVFQFYTMIVSP